MLIPRGGSNIELSERQERILAIVKDQGPITGEDIAEILSVSRAALRADLAVLTMAGFLDARPRVGYFYSGKTMGSLFAERIRKTKVNEVKSLPAVIRSDKFLYDAVVMLFVEDVGSLYVVNEEAELVGVLSCKDLLKNTLGGVNLERIPVEVAMSRMPNIITCALEESVWEAARKMAEYEVDSLPVVREMEIKGDKINSRKRYQVVGRISKGTVTRLFGEMGKM